MKLVTLVGALGLLMLPILGFADTMDVAFNGGTVIGPSNSLGTLGISGASVTSILIDSLGVAGIGSVNISLSGFTPTVAGETITTGSGDFSAGSATLTCTNCDGFSGLAFTGNLAGLDWTVSGGGSHGNLSGPIIGAFSPGFAAVLGLATGGTLADTITVQINSRVNGPGDMIINFTPKAPSAVPEPVTAFLLGSGLLGLLGLGRQRLRTL